ncbi:probable inactive leucine-rich repeat receptor-like protein kinase At3g03770 [Musa acuminata AAA Group]|uniref:probable inactive leucine-rich repeat receptor-like protein kinase At3g03770 n=1 Tax=Musa acuminata AAA Group TaxID=214697 RepID=UPI0031D85BCA
MSPGSYIACLLTLFVVLVLVPNTNELQSSEAWSLLRIQRLLNYPSVLSNWSTNTDFCNADPNPYLTVVCYEDSITQLHISGSENSPPLPRSFSIDSFFTTLTRLPNLKVLSLTSLGLWGPLPAKISRLSSLEIVNMSSNYLYGAIIQQVFSLDNLQTLILDHNMFSGRVPDAISKLHLLAVLSLRNNTFSGPLPKSFSVLESLRVLVLSSNSLSGDLPDLSRLTNLQVLNLENNYLGPNFPRLGRKVASIMLSKNMFGGGFPANLSSYYLLEQLDVSFNRFVGPFLPSLLSLPSIRYLNIAGNRFTGMLFRNMTCNDDLMFVDLSSNLLSGKLPTCLTSDSKNKVFLYSSNCLRIKDHSQHPSSFCQTQALAAGILPHKEMRVSGGRTAMAVGAAGGIVVSVSLVGLAVFFVLRRINIKRPMKKPPRRIVEHASNGYPPKLLADARYIYQTMKLGALGIPSYRSFSLEELEAATNNFETSSLMGKGSHGQLYRGKLKDGSLLAIRCLKLKKSQNSQNFNHHIELISKLRYHHLVSALGHCFEYHPDDSSVSRLFLIFEYVTNGTLRSNISVEGHKLTWMQRISTAIGVAKGIQFLHGGIIPGLFANDLKITNILLDQNLIAKISSYNLPVLAENMKAMVLAGSSSSGSNLLGERTKHLDTIDIYDFGVILLEIVSGRPIISTNELDIMKDELQENIVADGTARRSIVDPVISRQCCDESLKVVMEICLRCLSEEPTQRPSVEDVLWNLQFAAQVQESWRGDSQRSEESSLSPSQPPQSPIILN